MPYVNRDLTRTGLFRKETERKLLLKWSGKSRQYAK